MISVHFLPTFFLFSVICIQTCSIFAAATLPECRVMLYRLLNCEQCDQVFTNTTELAVHRNLIHKPTRGEHAKDRGSRKKIFNFKCAKCPLSYSCVEYLECHDKYFHGDKPVGNNISNNMGKTIFKCMVCQHESTTSLKLLGHITSKHTHLQTFQCNVCCKSFTSNGNRNYHKQIHSRQTWSCGICSAKFKQKQNLISHILQVHSSQNVQCKICRKIFKAECYLSRHMSYNHATEKPFSCNLCDKTFNKQYYLNEHYRSIHNNVRYYCDICNSSFKNKKYLAYHIEYKHSKNPPIFYCKKCPAKFGSKTCYDHHLRQVHGTGCFKCEMCGATFKCKQYLKRHMKGVHTGLVLYCTQCKYTTRVKINLIRHINGIHASKF
jgi:KRAB domain-containing zinc finger protein